MIPSASCVCLLRWKRGRELVHCLYKKLGYVYQPPVGPENPTRRDTHSESNNRKKIERHTTNKLCVYEEDHNTWNKEKTHIKQQKKDRETYNWQTMDRVPLICVTVSFVDNSNPTYLFVTIICECNILRFWACNDFAGVNFCDFTKPK